MELPNKSVPTPEPAPQKKIQPVISGASKTPRPATKRFFNYVFAESPGNMLKNMGTNVLMPRAKAALEEAMNGFIHGMFWGNGPAPISNIVKGNVLRGSAQVYHNAQNQQSALNQARQDVVPSRSGGNYEDVVCATPQDAEALLAQMYSTMNQYNVVAVADLYEMARIETTPSDNAFGWLSLDGARIVKDAKGYVLELPRPKLI